MTEIVKWLKKIWEVLTDLTQAQSVTNQSDWNEDDDTKSSYIKNKPELSDVATSGSYADLSNKPTIPIVTVVEGAVADNEFTPTEAAFADVLAAIAEAHGIVYLKYEDNSEDVYDMVVGASASQIITATSVTWEAPQEDPQENTPTEP